MSSGRQESPPPKRGRNSKISPKNRRRKGKAEQKLKSRGQSWFFENINQFVQ
jgi:hypothetical protein